MSNVAYSFSTSNGQPPTPIWREHFLADFQAAIVDQYYQVDITTEVPRSDELLISSARLSALDIVRFQAPGVSRCIRTVRHIRTDQSEVFVFWFVPQGRLRISQYGRDATISGDQFGLLNAGAPFRVSSFPGASGLHESYGVLVPRHTIEPHLIDARDHCSVSYPLNAMSRLASNVFLALFNESGAVDNDSLLGLMNEALKFVIAALRMEAKTDAEADRRSQLYNRVITCIDRRLGQQGLTARAIAQSCGISERQVHRAFEDQHGTFHDYILGQRLLRARTLLADAALAHLQVGEIAQMMGFKSASHFSRAYRNEFGKSPRSDRRMPPAGE